jgi:hypothetical protein
MKNLNKLLIILISVAFIASGLIAQNSALSRMKDPVEKQVKPAKPVKVHQVSAGIAQETTYEDLLKMRQMTELTLPAFTKKTGGGNGPTDSFCAPTYTAGCQYGDGFTDFAVEQIQNMGSGCANLNGLGWSEYYNLGPAILIPGNIYTFTMGTGFSNQYVNIWIDFNDDLTLTPDEIILNNFYLASAGVLYYSDVTIPANAVPGQHAMRAMAVYAATFTDPCGSYYYGEAEDYTVVIGVAEYGDIEGYVTANTGGSPISGANLSINNGMYTATSAANGFYQLLNVLVGTWNINCTKTGYNPISSTVIVIEGQTTTKNFAMTAPTMDITPAAINVIVDPFGTATEYVTIDNNGDGSLGWNSSIEYLTKDNSVPNLMKGSQAYAVKVYPTPAEVVSFDTDDPGTFTTIVGTALDPFAGDFGIVSNSLLYVITNTAPSKLYSIDINTGAETLIAAVTGMTGGQSVSGMACDKSTGIMYVSSTSITASDIYTVNLATGALTLIGTTGIPGVIEIAIDGTGTMYAWDIVNDEAFTVDKTTGASTLLGPLGYDLNYAQGGNWDPESDQIYLAAYTFAGQLMTMDKTTGALTLIGDFPGGAEVDCLAFPGAAENWLSIAPSNGTINAGGTFQMTVNFDALDIIAGTVKTANIHFTSNPQVGTVTIPVSMTVGSLAFGYITGNINLNGIAPYNFGNIQDVLVEAGPYSSYPDINGDYSITAYPGTYDVTAILYGYTQQAEPGIIVGEGATVPGIDFTMPCIYGRAMGTVYDEPSGLPLPNATVKVEGTTFSTTTAGDGTYELFVEAGTYNVTAFDITHTPLTEPNVAIPVQGDVTVDFSLQPGLATVYPSNGDYWTGTCLPTTKTEISYVKGWGSPNNDTGEQGWMKFDISAMPVGAVILGVTFHGYVTNTNFPYWSITPMPVDPVTSAATDIYSAATAGSPMGIAYAYLNEPSTYAPGWKEYPLVEGNIINDFTNAMSQGWFAVGIYERDYSNTYYIEFDGWNEPNVPYLVIDFFIPSFGVLNGTVTETASGNPIQGANITAVGPYSTYNFTTDADGVYQFDPCQTGSYSITCNATGFNVETATVDVTEGNTTTQDFSLTEPQFIVAPLVVTQTLEPNATAQQTLNLTNPGNGPVNWSASLSILSKSSGASDAKGSQAYAIKVYPTLVDVVSFDTDDPGTFTTISSGSSLDPFAGDFDNVNTSFMYVITYSTNSLYTIDIATGAETFIAPVSGITGGQSITGMACDKTTGIMYVSTTDITFSDIYTIDLTTGVLSLIGTTGIPGLIEIAIDGTGTMYGWDIVNDESFTIDKNTGVSSVLGPLGVDLNYAQGGNWDPLSDIIYLAAYSTSGQLMTLDKTTGALTYIGDFPGGAEVDALAFPGGFNAWLSIDPHSGTLNANGAGTMTLDFDATDLIPGIYEAEILFGTNPNVGSPLVNVTLTVEGLIPATNLNLSYSCTNVILTWEMPAGGFPDSWNVYRDGVLLGNTTEMSYTNQMVMPEVEYGYYVKAVYAGEESMPTITKYITVPTPTNLEPNGLEAIPNVPSENDVTLNWDAPDACLAPDGYDVYRDGSKINTSLVTALTYVDVALPIGLYEYYVVAVYYFGESEPSDPVYTLITGIEDADSDMFRIYPNPASGMIYIESSIGMTGIRVINNAGQIVLDKIVDVNKYKINVAKYEKGIYYIKIETAEGNKLCKITVN